MTASEQAVQLVTPAIREAVEEYNKICRSMRKKLGKDWMNTVPEDLGPYMLKMHQLCLLVWIADHPREEKEDYEEGIRKEQVKEAYRTMVPTTLPVSPPEGVKGVVIGSPEFMQQLAEYKKRS